MNVLELSHVTKRYGDFVAVNDLSLNVAKGKTLSLLGPSGCGKTTTLRMISGFEEANEGSISFSGNNAKGKRPYEREVGLLFQDYALFPHMNVEDNIGYGLKYRGFDKKRISTRVTEMLELVKLSGFQKRLPNHLSGGQQQRIALARLLATSPKVVLLDEPLSALDEKMRQALRFELKEILGAVDATTIVVTHNQEEAMSLGDNVVVMSNGKIMQQGSPTDIYANPKTKYVAEFIGLSNWFSGHVGVVEQPDVQQFRTKEGLQLWVPAQCDASVRDYEVCIRPERIRVERARNTPSDTLVNSFNGTVLDVAHLGADIHMVIEIGGNRQVTATEQYNGQALGSTGENVCLTFLPQDCIVVAKDS